MKFFNSLYEAIPAYFKKPRVVAVIHSFVTIILIFIAWTNINTWLENRLLAEAQAQLSKDINLYRSSLSQAINNKVALSSGLNTYLENELLYNSPEKDELATLIERIYEDSSGIRNIALAPDGVMQFVYPYEENKSVLGYEPAIDERPAVRADVNRAVATRQVILSLPIELIQGGQGIIARKAIFFNDTYWGLSNIVIDLPALLEEAGITPPPTDIELALKDQSGRVFYGSAEVFDANPVIVPVSLTEGVWLLAGVPVEGWKAHYQDTLNIYQSLGFSIGLLITVLIYVLSFRQTNLTQLIEQRTSELSKANTQLQEDIIKREQAEQSLRKSEAQAIALLDAIPDIMFRLNSEGVVLDYRATPEQLYTGDQPLIGRKLHDLMPPDFIIIVMPKIAQTLASRETQIFDFSLSFNDQGAQEFEARMIESGENEVIAIIRDITEKKQAEDALLHMATHDNLTTLSNRNLLNDRLIHAIDLANRKNKLLAVFFLDLDGFKAVNDAFGHKQGDWLLQHISERLNNSMRKADTLARFGGDEFVILLEDIGRPEEVSPIAEKIIQAISAPVILDGTEVFITSSIGISIYPHDGETPDTLLENADRAMYYAKEHGKNQHQYYSSTMRTKALERLELRNQLRQALARQEFSLHYQPQIDLLTGQIFGIEALLRWQHPTRGAISPRIFIPLAEETGLIISIGEWVLQTACQQLRVWINQGLPALRLAINISGPELKRTDIAEKVKSALDKTNIPPEMLELELSENIVFQDMEEALPLLESLKQLGVRIAIDDFGIGYSTLSQLAHFPFDTLKIDQHFAPHVTTSINDAAIVNGIMTIAKNLNLDVVAEGVEDSEQLAFYKELGCHHIQGHIFSKALPAEEIELLLRKRALSAIS